MADKILILTGDGGESYETWYAYHRFQEAGYEPHVASLQARRLHMVMHDFEEGWDTYVERPGYAVVATVSVAAANPSDYRALLIIGGRAPEYLRDHAVVIRLVQGFDRPDKHIFSICHGAQILTAAGMIKGKKVACFGPLQSDIRACGGTWVDAPVAVDGQLITAPNWGAHPAFYQEIFKALGR